MFQAQGQLDGEIPLQQIPQANGAATLLHTRDTGTPIPPQMSANIPTPTGMLSSPCIF